MGRGLHAPRLCGAAGEAMGLRVCRRGSPSVAGPDIQSCSSGP